MKQFQVNYRTNMTGAVIGCDSVEQGKAVIAKLTKDAEQTSSAFDSVEFFISDFYTDEILYTSPRYVTKTVGDINDVNNLRP